MRLLPNLRGYYTLLTLFLLYYSSIAVAQAVIINEVMAVNNSGVKDEFGETSDWVEVHNPYPSSVALRGYQLSDDLREPDKFVFPDTMLGPNGYLIVWISGREEAGEALHAPFKIKGSGEALYLYGADGRLIDESPAVALTANQTIGRSVDDLEQWYFLASPTPGIANEVEAYADAVAAPRFSLSEGLYIDSIQVGILREYLTDTIVYTTDGSIPDRRAQRYTSPLTITESTSVRARIYRSGSLPSPVATASYLMEDTSLPVVSLVTQRSNLFGSRGIYTNNKSGQERPVRLSYFTTAGEPAFSLDMGIKIHSPEPARQQSLRLYARPQYGKEVISYPLFGDRSVGRFRRLVLRNGGNDSSQKGRLHLKDGFAHRLYQQLDADYAAAAYQPVNVFLNGDYFGIYNLRERQDEHYLEAHFGFGPAEVDFLEYDYAEPNRKKTISGDWNNWEALRQFVLTGDLGKEANYRQIEQWVDLTNFIDYQIFEIFVGNQDWLNNNIKFWRPHHPAGRWKWVLWDTEYGMATQAGNTVGKPNYDFLNMARSWGGWGDGDYTWLLRNLLVSPAFRERFIRRYLDLHNTLFLSDYLLAELEAVRQVIEPDLPRQLARWGGTAEKYEKHYATTVDFLQQRGEYNIGHLIAGFDLEDSLSSLTVDVNDTTQGNVAVNTLLIDARTPGWQRRPYPWTGRYTPDYPVHVTAIPRRGYAFSHWEGDTSSLKTRLDVTLSSNYSLRAVFRPATRAEVPQLLINEVLTENTGVYADRSGRLTDWFEIYNPGEQPISLADLYMTDDPGNPTKWQVTSRDRLATLVEPGGYLTLHASGATDRSDLHTNFMLNRGGEYLGIYYRAPNGILYLVDAISVPALATNQTYGRLPNGSATWTYLDAASPNASNDNLPVSAAPAPDPLRLSIYPNPVAEQLYVTTENTGEKLWLTISNAVGQSMYQSSLRGGRTRRVAVVGWPPGIYTATITSLSGQRRGNRRIAVISR